MAAQDYSRQILAMFVFATYHVLKSKHLPKIATSFEYQLKSNCQTQIFALNKNNCIYFSVVTEIKITYPWVF